MTCMLAAQLAISTFDRQFRVMGKLAKKLQAENADAIHDVRVASRRIRAAISEYGGIFCKTPMRKLRNDVREITRSLSEARQLDVSIALIAGMKPDVADKTARAALNFVARELVRKRHEFSAKVGESAAKIQSSEFKELYGRALRPARCRKRCILTRAVGRISAKYQEAIDAYLKWKQTKEMQDLHRLRIASKKLRYTCETYKAVCGDEVEDVIESLKEMQDVLGEWHDWAMLLAFAAEVKPLAGERAAGGFMPLGLIVSERSGRLLAKFGRMAPVLLNAKTKDKLVAALTPVKNRPRKKGEGK